MNKSYKRRRLFIDRPIQLALLARALSYWTICLIMQIVAVGLLPSLTNSPDDMALVSERLWWTMGLGIIGSMVALPLILLDVLRLSHRWVGPIFRLRSFLRQVRQGERVEELRFRDGDFWPELADDFNAIIAELNRARAGQQSAGPLKQPALIAASDEL